LRNFVACGVFSANVGFFAWNGRQRRDFNSIGGGRSEYKWRPQKAGLEAA
jgi:hypothetical protein